MEEVTVDVVSKLDDQGLKAIFAQIFVEGFNQGKNVKAYRLNDSQVREFAEENASMVIHNIEMMDLLSPDFDEEEDND